MLTISAAARLGSSFWMKKKLVFFPFVYMLKMHLQHIEGFEPRSGLVTLLHALTEQRVIEMLQLVFEHILFAVVINRRESGMMES